jgi:dTDP-4-dehydrorhamnose reductase
MKKILLTGSSGFLGGHVYQQGKNRYEICPIYFHNKPIDAPATWRCLDLADQSALMASLEQIQPDIVIHSAAISNLDTCEANPDFAHHVNVDATSYLAEYAARNAVRLIFISSDMVFNGEKGMYSEDEPVSALAVYGKTKILAEELIRKKCSNYAILRSALIYGKPAINGTSFSEWIRKRLEKEEKVTLYIDQYRTPILAENLAEAILELAEHDFVGTLHLAGPNRVDRLTFGRQLCQAGNYDENLLQSATIKEGCFAAPRPVDVSLCIKKAQSILATRFLSTEEGLERMLC